MILVKKEIRKHRRKRRKSGKNGNRRGAIWTTREK